MNFRGESARKPSCKPAVPQGETLVSSLAFFVSTTPRTFLLADSDLQTAGVISVAPAPFDTMIAQDVSSARMSSMERMGLTEKRAPLTASEAFDGLVFVVTQWSNRIITAPT